MHDPGFPDFKVGESGKRLGVWKRQNNPHNFKLKVHPLRHWHLRHEFEAFGCRWLVFLVLALACAALRFGLLLSTLSRLAHILLVGSF
jgi:hypothetical protein